MTTNFIMIDVVYDKMLPNCMMTQYTEGYGHCGLHQNKIRIRKSKYHEMSVLWDELLYLLIVAFLDFPNTVTVL